MSVQPPGNIEKALQSNSLPDHLAAIAQCSKAIKDNPFPAYVNTLLFRLADVFLGDKIKMEQSLNLIRLRIVKLLKECDLDLSASSSEDIIRRIMKVSHSNDYKARSLAMLFLAAVAPIVSSNKKVHYLLVEGLDCEDSTELMSAIIAAGSLGRLSSDFSSIVVEKIGSMLCQDQIDISIKVRLMEDLSFFQENLAVTKYCMELGRHLLRSQPGQRISVAIISALTELSKHNGRSLGDQITLILDEIGRVENNEALLTCYLANLLELTALPHHWNSEHIMQLCKYRDNVRLYDSNKPLILWLKSLNCLIEHTQADILASDDFFESLIPLTTVKNFTVKIQLADVIYSKLRNIKNQERSILLNDALNTIIHELERKDCCISMEDRIRFYKMIVKYIRNDDSYFVNIDGMTFVEFLIRIDSTYSEQVFLMSLETLNLICSIKPEFSRSVCNWALRTLQKNYGMSEKKQLCDAPIDLYSLALQPLPTYADKIRSLISTIQSELTENKKWWFAYKLARLGLHNGHCLTVGLPLLEQLQCNNIEVSSFIMVLIYVAKSQLPNDFDIPTLNAAQKNLRYASLLLTPLLQTSRNAHDFMFAANYIDCLYDLLGAFNTILVALNANMGFLPSFDNNSHMDYLYIPLNKARQEFYDVRHKWLALQNCSFDVDDQTQQQLELLCRYCQLFESLLTRIFAAEVVELAPLPQDTSSFVNSQLQKLINWGIEKTNANIHAVTGAQRERSILWKNNYVSFSRIFSYLSVFPLCLPRSFFHQRCRTKIKLNVTPQPREHDHALTLSSKQFALSVEGVIETNNPKPIQTITVYVKAFVDKKPEPSIVDRRSCPVRDNYFKVNFLLHISKNAEIVTSVKFVDSIEKQTWDAGNFNRFHVVAPDSRD